MPQYHFVDGPLAGQCLAPGGQLTAGEVLAVEVVDVLDGPDGAPLFDYVVEQTAGEHGPGLLRLAG